MAHPSAHPRLLHPKLLGLAGTIILATGGTVFGWSAGGTVRSTLGTPLQGVTVTVKDSSSIFATTTDASGKFTIERSVAVGPSADRGLLSIRRSGSELLVRCPGEGTLEASIVDLTGATIWRSQAVLSDGAASFAVPTGNERSTGILSIRLGGELISRSVVLLGANGWREAPPAVAARTLAAFPVLVFKKSGYKDTTFAMTSESVRDAAVVMSDTTSSQTVVCPSTKLASGDQNKTISVKGVTRKYILHVPSAYKGDTPVPLLVDYHPIGGSASGQSGSTQYKAQADKDGAISVYPDGLTGPMGQAWNVKGCCVKEADDTAFARALVAEVKKTACIDPKRVYAAGFSMGGGMTHFTACHLADIFAAAAPAAFDLLKENVDICKPARPITMVIFRGTSDPVVPYKGGASNVVSGMPINFLGAKESAAKWAELNKCTGSPSAEDGNGCSTYSNCAGGVQVTLCTKQGGGHDQGNGSIGWPILKKYTLP